ncbi:MAG: alcohol dehydrogenase catalytic domain-containing protein [Deltaproteobacteria bacterium]|nr:alcohol dehydrogenase catalytic domain-containing protein [Deltaproteobacteria bacterium]
MKAGFLTTIGKIEVRDIPYPELKSDHEVMLKVERVGICGSDIHYFTDGKIGTQIVNFPFLIGHEFSGTVVETGKNVKRLQKGDRVAVDPGAFCGQCDRCKAGKFNLCRNLIFVGSPLSIDGCLTEYIAVPEESCFASKSLSLDALCLIEPLSIAVYSLKYAFPLDGKNIGILGLGPIGLSVLISARAYNSGNIYVTDKIDSRCKLSENHGATWTGNPLRDDIVSEIGKREPFLLDVVFECCGQQEALDQAVRLIKPGGTLVLVGIPLVDKISLSSDLIRRHEITIFNVRRQNETILETIELIENGKMKVDFLATHHFPLHESQKAFDTVTNYQDEVIKALIIP